MSTDQGLRLAELRHRLGGNLQLLQALVAVRLRAVADPESRRHLAWLADVIAALDLLNRRLEDDGPADFALYLADTAGFWRRACAGRRISFSLDTGELPIPPAVASTLALIVHELIAGAVEHATEHGAGRVDIVARRQGGLIELSVRDDGDASPEREVCEGIKVARGLAEHLGGTMDWSAGPGGVAAVVRAPVALAPAPPSRH